MAVIVFDIMRRLGSSLGDSMLLVAVMLSSSSFLFWWSVVETFPIAAVNILLPFWLLVCGVRSLWGWVVVVALSLAITTTNLSSGVLACLASPRQREILRVLVIATGLVCVLSIIQQSYLPYARHFWMPDSVLSEQVHVQTQAFLDPGALFGRSLDFLVHTAVVPSWPGLDRMGLIFVSRSGHVLPFPMA